MSNEFLITTLEKILMSFGKLRDLLHDDQQLFEKNNLADIENSNEAKSTLLQDLLPLVQTIQSQPHAQQGLLSAIHSRIELWEEKEKYKAKKIIQQIEIAIGECYQRLLVNNKIVHGNLSQLNGLWSQLLSIKNEKTCVYDSKANTGIK